MSRGFVKESDQEPAPMVPPRAALPADAVNYVTPRGLRLLNEEQDELEAELKQLASATDGPEARRDIIVARGRLVELGSRLGSVTLVEPDEVAGKDVRFGSTVTYAIKGAKPVIVTIVGVDEANLKEKRISYLSPIAQALTGKHAGETTEMTLGDDVKVLEVMEVTYKS